MLKSRRECALDYYKLAIGGFIFLSPWLFALHYSTSRLDAWASGILLMVLSAAAIIAFVDWKEWLALALGLWLLTAPWILGLPHAATTIHIAAGLLCTYLAGLELWLVHYHHLDGANPR